VYISYPRATWLASENPQTVNHSDAPVVVQWNKAIHTMFHTLPRREEDDKQQIWLCREIFKCRRTSLPWLNSPCFVFSYSCVTKCLPWHNCFCYSEAGYSFGIRRWLIIPSHCACIHTYAYTCTRAYILWLPFSLKFLLPFPLSRFLAAEQHDKSCVFVFAAASLLLLLYVVCLSVNCNILR